MFLELFIHWIFFKLIHLFQSYQDLGPRVHAKNSNKLTLKKKLMQHNKS